MPKSVATYIRRNFDEAAILAVASKLAFQEAPQFSESELATIAAMQRAHPQAGVTPQEISNWLATLTEEQIRGVISNTKGVLHEMEFVRLENDDGDSLYAALYQETNHPDFDIQLIDETGTEAWALQLKASDSASYVQDWLDAHPDGAIRVTSELAEAMGLPSSGMSHTELQLRVDQLVDRLQEASDSDMLWEYFPALTAVSVALVVWSLFQRFQRGEIDWDRFRSLTGRMTGLKAGKIAVLTLAMSTPGLNVVTGAALIVSLVYGSAAFIKSAGR